MANIRGFADLKKEGEGATDDGSANYYAGGIGQSGEGSGVAIQLPGGNDPLMSVLRTARAQGKKTTASATEATVSIELYRNGFIVVQDGKRGPFREKNDPANKQFLADLQRGFVPRELKQRATNTPLEIALLDKSAQEYKEPPKSKPNFTGSGQKLGTPDYGDIAETGAVASGIVAGEISLKEGEKPVKMRVRLSNGKSITVTCNGSHTVAEVKSHVKFLSGDQPNADFLLLAGHPPKPLTNLDATVEQSKLGGATIIQRMK